MSDAAPRRPRLAAAGLLGAGTAFALLVGVGPAPSVLQLAGANEEVSGNCDEAEHANDPGCAGTVVVDRIGGSTSSTVTTVQGSTSTTATVPPAVPPASDVRAIDAAGAGVVLVAVEGGGLRLVTATPAAGWRVEVEQAAGREVEVDFRVGSKRVQVNVETEGGRVRERVRVRDDADGTDARSENGTVVRDDSEERGGDNRGPGSGRDDDRDDSEDRSGSGADD